MNELPKTPKGQDRQQRLIAAANRLFLKVGFEGVTFAMVAKAAGVTQPALYGYFDDKVDLLYYCSLTSAAHGRTFIDSKMNSHSDARERLSQYVLGNLQWVLQHRELASSLVAIYYFATTHKKLRELHMGIQTVGIERISALVAAGNREHQWKVSDPGECAHWIRSLLVGEMFRAFHFPEEFKSKNQLNQTIKGVERLLGKD